MMTHGRVGARHTKDARCHGCVCECACRDTKTSHADDQHGLTVPSHAHKQGSGNIIKNEALFLAGLNPFLSSRTLTMERALDLVGHVRSFSLLFKRCRESAQSLRKVLHLPCRLVAPCCTCLIVLLCFGPPLHPRATNPEPVNPESSNLSRESSNKP
jgi:hypothetical protein